MLTKVKRIRLTMIPVLAVLGAICFYNGVETNSLKMIVSSIVMLTTSLVLVTIGLGVSVISDYKNLRTEE